MHAVKVAVVGSTNTGKSSLVSRLCGLPATKQTSKDTKPTVAFDTNVRKCINITELIQPSNPELAQCIARRRPPPAPDQVRNLSDDERADVLAAACALTNSPTDDISTMTDETASAAENNSSSALIDPNYLFFRDCSGDAVYRQCRHKWYAGVDAVIATFDITNRNSFQALQMWTSEIDLVSRQPHQSDSSGVVKIIVATKYDRQAQRQVDDATAVEFAKQVKYHYVRTSAKTMRGVDELFRLLWLEVYYFRRHRCLSVPQYSTQTAGSGGTSETKREPRVAKAGGDAPSGVVTETSPITAKTNIKTSEPAPIATADQMRMIKQILSSKSAWEILGFKPATASERDVNRVYKRMAAMIHPDKCPANDSSEAAKVLNIARQEVLDFLHRHGSK